VKTKVFDKIDYGDIKKYNFTPGFKIGKWYITEVRKITLYADREWSDPECVLSIHCAVTVMTGKKDKGWLMPYTEDYNNVWIDVTRGEFINYTEMSTGTFRLHQKFPIANAEIVLAQIREKMNEDIEEKKKK